MNLSRRELAALLPALAAGNAAAQTTPAPMLPSKIYHNNQIPYVKATRPTGRAFNLEMHETILGPGTETHAPH